MSSLNEIQKKAEALRRQLAKVDKLTGKADALQADAARKHKARLATRLFEIPECENKSRRKRLEKNDVKWLRYYFGPISGTPDPFTYEFTEQQLKMIQAFAHAIVFGGDQAIAASRGEGKTTIVERLVIKYTLTGKVDYTQVYQAAARLAVNSLDSMKSAIETNEALLKDYPEVCVPVRALENTPQRAHSQIASGKRHDNGNPFKEVCTRFSWCGDEITFPDVPGSPSAGAIISTIGLDGSVRGSKKRGKRPKLAIIDDPDTNDTARSEDQANKLADKIDKDIGGLGGQQSPIARLMICTLQSRTCVAYRFTDPATKPSWRGVRFRYLIHPPERQDLWEDYVSLRQLEQYEYATEKNEDPHCRKSHQFYLDNREAMEVGAVVANPNRFDATKLPDGSQVEVSALQRYYNEVARIGPESVATEYDNDPPEEDGPIESGITAAQIQHSLSGYGRRVVPPECVLLTQGIDVGKMGLYWVLKAWRADATCYVVDYGFHETHGTTYGSDEGVELAIRRATIGRFEWMEENPCHALDGEISKVDLTLIDSGYKPEAVYQACKDIGLGVYPAKGCGKSHGCVSSSFSPVVRSTMDKRPGDGWYLSRQRGGVWLVNCDTDRWKAFEHARWMTADGKPGASYLFGSMTADEERLKSRRMPTDSREHHGFARHITAELEVEDVVRGKLRREWRLKHSRAANHYLDASYLADVAASMKGIRLLSDGAAKLAEGDRPTLAQLAGR